MTASEPDTAATTSTRTRGATSRRALRALRFLVPLCVFAALLSIVPLRDILASVASVPLRAVAVCIAVYAVIVGVSAARWRILFAACEMPGRPSLPHLYRAYLIGNFYNTYLPGNVGGEVIRAIATRHAVGERGLPAAIAIVFLERVLGFAALLILVATIVSLFPLRAMPDLMLWSGLGLSGAAGALIAVVSAPRLAPYLPGPLSRIAAALPTIASVPLVGLALGLSLLTHLGGVVIGHVVISSITEDVAWTDSLVVLPMANASTYFPLAVGGAGVREAAFVLGYGLVGVRKADALATSLVLTVLSYAVNAVGGVLHLLAPLTRREAARATPTR